MLIEAAGTEAGRAGRSRGMMSARASTTRRRPRRRTSAVSIHRGRHCSGSGPHRPRPSPPPVSDRRCRAADIPSRQRPWRSPPPDCLSAQLAAGRHAQPVHLDQPSDRSGTQMLHGRDPCRACAPTSWSLRRRPDRTPATTAIAGSRNAATSAGHPQQRQRNARIARPSPGAAASGDRNHRLTPAVGAIAAECRALDHRSYDSGGSRCLVTVSRGTGNDLAGEAVAPRSLSRSMWRKANGFVEATGPDVVLRHGQGQHRVALLA